MRIKGKGYKKSGMISEYVRKTMWFLFEDHAHSIRNTLKCRRSLKQALIDHKSNPYTKVRWKIDRYFVEQNSFD